MNEKRGFGVLLTVVLVSLSLLSGRMPFQTSAVEEDSGASVMALQVHNLNTTLNYSTIQAAIDDNNTLDGHVISVDNGTYNEHVLVDKSLTLLGQSKENTTILWEGGQNTLDVTANNVSVRGFTVQRSANTTIGNSTVCFQGVSGVNLTNCVVQYGYFGVLVVNSTGCLVDNVTIRGSGSGLSVLNSSYSVLRDNEILDGGVGLTLSGSVGCLLRGNRMVNCSSGFLEAGLAVEDFFNDVDLSNTIDGKPVYCLVNQTGLNVNPLTFPDVGSLTIANSTGVVVENLTLSNSGFGVELAFTNDSSVKNVVVADNTGGYGIVLFSAVNDTVLGCNVSDCFSGVTVSYSMNNTVRHNTIVNSNHFGIYSFASMGNVFVENDVLNSDWTCVYIAGSDNNVFYHNNFANYSEVSVDGHANAWDDGVEGNYWTGYAGVDLNLDGIGDVPYVLHENNFDNYPLMGMYRSYDVDIPFPVPAHYVVDIISNSTVSAFDWAIWIEHPEMRIATFNVSGADGFGFVRMRIPNDFITGPYSVTVDGAEPIYANYSVLTEGNNTWIYFSYLHSEHVVVVVPEFSVLALLPLLMTVSLLTVAVCKRKRLR